MLADLEAFIASQLHAPVAVVVAGLWGLLWGSFGNVCIHRVPLGQSVVRPASHCPHCQKEIAWFDNVPVLGWLMLRGRCRQCAAPISALYPLFELLGGVLAVVLYLRFVALGGETSPPLLLAQFLVYFGFALTLAVLSVIDWQLLLLPDRITLPAIPLFYVLGRVLGDIGWLDALIGSAVGYLLIRAVSDGYYYLTGREGLGYGDGKLLGLIGALLGWQALPWTLLMGSVSACLISFPLLLWRRRAGQEIVELRQTPVPFGPFLSLGALAYLLMLHGRNIDEVMLSLFSRLGLARMLQ
ncbi:MAG TPA: prepilin peptidase [Pseudomonadota bacterium]|nr:prepilin peptidase [Deltaproteobacteria bacterium]HPH26539.1 prepilin peptidase [Pseudomonadota bacterium]